jgi:hypothetical protein
MLAQLGRRHRMGGEASSKQGGWWRKGVMEGGKWCTSADLER